MERDRDRIIKKEVCIAMFVRRETEKERDRDRERRKKRISKVRNAFDPSNLFVISRLTSSLIIDKSNRRRRLSRNLSLPVAFARKDERPYRRRRKH